MSCWPRCKIDHRSIIDNLANMEHLIKEEDGPRRQGHERRKEGPDELINHLAANPCSAQSDLWIDEG